MILNSPRIISARTNPATCSPQQLGYTNFRNSATSYDIQQRSRESRDSNENGRASTHPGSSKEDGLAGRNTEGGKRRTETRKDTLSSWLSMRRPQRDHGPSRESYISLLRETTGEHAGDDGSGSNRRWMLRPWINHHYDCVENSSVPAVFSPEAKFITVWNNVILIPVFWSLFAVPIEAATTLTFCMLKECVLFHLWWHFDTISTCVFAFSVLLKFNTAIEHKDGSLDFDRGDISSDYLFNWFVLDFLGALPFEILAMNLRVLKLFRVANAIRLLYARGIYNCVLVTLLVTHWISCLWFGLALVQGTGGESWVDALSATKAGVDESVERTPLRLYLWSAYYAVTLVTTVGFGDVTPQTDTECMCCMASTFLGTLIWAYVQSSVLSWVCELSASELKDELNLMIQEYRIEGELKRDVQQYFQNSEKNIMFKQRRQLFDKMSPTLRGRVMFSLWGEVVRKVPFISRIYLEFSEDRSNAFVKELCQLFDMGIFGKGERVSSAKLTILQQGIVWHGKAVKISGQFFGDDFLLSNPENRCGPALAVTFVSALTVARREFLGFVRDFPEEMRIVRQASLWVALKQGAPRVMRQLGVEQGFGRSSMTTTFLSRMSPVLGRRTQLKLAPGAPGASAFSMVEEMLEEQRDMLEKQATEIQESRKREEVIQELLERGAEEHQTSMARLENVLEEQRLQRVEAFERLELMCGGGHLGHPALAAQRSLSSTIVADASTVRGSAGTVGEAKSLTTQVFNAISPKKPGARASSGPPRL